MPQWCICTITWGQFVIKDSHVHIRSASNCEKRINRLTEMCCVHIFFLYCSNTMVSWQNERTRFLTLFHVHLYVYIHTFIPLGVLASMYYWLYKIILALLVKNMTTTMKREREYTWSKSLSSYHSFLLEWIRNVRLFCKTPSHTFIHSKLYSQTTHPSNLWNHSWTSSGGCCCCSCFWCLYMCAQNMM